MLLWLLDVSNLLFVIGWYVFYHLKENWNMEEKINIYLNDLGIKDLNMKIGILLGISFELALEKIKNQEDFLKSFPDINNINDLIEVVNVFYSRIKIENQQNILRNILNELLKNLNCFDEGLFTLGLFISKDFKFLIKDS